MSVMLMEGKRRRKLCTQDKGKALQKNPLYKTQMEYYSVNIFIAMVMKSMFFQHASALSMRVADFHFLLRSILLCQDSITADYTENTETI